MPQAPWLLAHLVFRCLALFFHRCCLAGLWMFVSRPLFQNSSGFRSESSHLWCPKLEFGKPDVSLLGTWETSWVAWGVPWGAKGAAEGTLWNPESFFLLFSGIFRDCILGAIPAPCNKMCVLFICEKKNDTCAWTPNKENLEFLG